MKFVIAFVLTVCSALPSCSLAQTKASPEKWLVVLSSAGGFTGRGAGGVKILPAGEALLISGAIGGQTSTTLNNDLNACTTRLEPAEYESLRNAISSAFALSKDNAAVRAPKCCDRVNFQLSIQLVQDDSEQKPHQIRWTENDDTDFPPAIRELIGKVLLIKRNLQQTCTSK